MTKEQAFKARIKNQKYRALDYALPHPWVEKQSRLHNISYGEIVSNFVWLYKKDSTFGEPFPLTAKGDLILAQIDCWSRE